MIEALHRQTVRSEVAINATVGGVSARASAQQRKHVAYAGFQNFGRELRVGDCT